MIKYRTNDELIYKASMQLEPRTYINLLLIMNDKRTYIS